MSLQAYNSLLNLNFSNEILENSILGIKNFKISAKKIENVFVPTFDTKVTEYLCSGWVFFQTNFDILTSHF